MQALNEVFHVPDKVAVRMPPQYGTDAGEQFPEAEWFYDIIVRPEFEADDAINFVGTMAGRDDDRHIRMRTNFPQIQPVILTEPQIQDDQAWRGPCKKAVELCPARCSLRWYIVVFQKFDHHLSQRWVIINDNDMSAIREHELISQLFWSLSGIVLIDHEACVFSV